MGSDREEQHDQFAASYRDDHDEALTDHAPHSQGEQALRELFAKVERAKREWESAIDSLPELVCLVDRQGQVMRANRTVEAWNLGLVIAVNGRELHTLLHPGCSGAGCELMAFLKDALQQAIQGQVRQREINDPFLKRHILVNVRPVLDHQGQVSATTVVVVHDITERKRVEEAEREQRALAEALRDTAAALNSTLHFDEVLDRILANVGRVVPHDRASIMLIDSDSTVVNVVRWRDDRLTAPVETAQALRVSVADMPALLYMAETGEPIVAPTVKTDSAWSAVPGVGQVRSYAGAPIRVKGHVIGFLNLDSATPNFFTPAQGDRLQAFADQAAVAIENARLYAMLNRHADELELRVIERTTELERERYRLQTILDSVGEGIILTDYEEHIVYCNTAMERLSGYTFAEMIGQTPRLWKSGYTSAAVYEDMKRTLANGEVWRGEVINRRKDGTLYDAALTITPMSVAGETVGYVSVQRDISRIKELNRLKDQFVTRIGHELRTPVANIRLYIDLLERGRSEKHGHYLHTLRSETDRMVKLIGGFLEMSELTSGTAPFHLTPVNLNHLMRDLIEGQRDVAEARGLVLDFYLEPNLPAALADREMVARVAANLLENALDYTPRGGRVTLVTARNWRLDHEWVSFSVQDSGPGISATEMPRLFERFYRGEAARNFTTPGTGLGLAICKEIVNRLGGKITVDSQPGQGAMFTVWLRPSIGDVR
ncbi:MAG TPA: ATP-binding protein [Anaerolineae bacterium]